MSRYRAAASHLGISLGVFIVLAAITLTFWYPGFFFELDGGWQGLRLLFCVDMVAGPLLTLIVYRAGKRGLAFDLSVIALFQSCCLALGLFVVYNERPLFLIYYDGHFYSSNAGAFTSYGVTPPDYRKFTDRSPAMVYVDLPNDPIEEADVQRIFYNDSVPLWTYSRLYAPLQPHLKDIVNEGTDIKRVRQWDKEKQLDDWLADHGGVADDYAFFPVRARYASMFLGVRKSDATIVGIVDIPIPAPTDSPG
ncbi:MAG: hypothetical protein KDI19_07995 [Pseudomonadales bacterium]|nr:hypothetical protein [Pseudomonadales bacterium]